VAGLPVASRRLEYWISSFSAAREQQRQQLRFADYTAVWTRIESAPPSQRPSLAASIGLPALAALSAAYDAVGVALMSALDSFGDIGVLNDLNQQTHSQGVAVAAEQLGTYVSVPPSVLPVKTYSGPPRALSPNASPVILQGAPFTIDIWVVSQAPPAAVQLCTAIAAASLACVPMTRVGTGAVYRASIEPPAPDFEAWAVVSLGGGNGTLYVPESAPDTPWHVSVV
jgi:hypothetical protein